MSEDEVTNHKHMTIKSHMNYSSTKTNSYLILFHTHLHLKALCFFFFLWGPPVHKSQLYLSLSHSEVHIYHREQRGGRWDTEPRLCQLRRSQRRQQDVRCVVNQSLGTYPLQLEIDKIGKEIDWDFIDPFGRFLLGNSSTKPKNFHNNLVMETHLEFQISSEISLKHFKKLFSHWEDLQELWRLQWRH